MAGEGHLLGVDQEVEEQGGAPHSEDQDGQHVVGQPGEYLPALAWRSSRRG